MTVEHVDIVDPAVHEPKGASTASSGEVYISDGAGSGVWKKDGNVSTVLIDAEADFPTPSAGIITLAANTDYLVGDSFTTSNRFLMQENSLLRGIDSSQATLTYSGTGDMITAIDVSSKVTTLGLSCASGTVFNVSSTSGNNDFQIVDLTIIACNKLGLVNNLRGMLFTNISFGAVVANGIDFTGNTQVFLAKELRGTLSAGSLFNLGTATFDDFSYEEASVTLNGSSVLLTGATGSANINSGGLGAVLNTRIAGTGTALSGISVDDVRWNFALNDIIPDTRPDALVYLLGNTTDTVITTVDTPVIVEGVWSEARTSQMSSDAGGKVTYNGEKDITVPITANLTATTVSGGDKDISFYLAKNGTVITNSKSSNLVRLNSKGNTTVVWQEVVANGDYFEVYVENNTDAVDVLVSDAKLRLN